jgi:hypothetical protein
MNKLLIIAMIALCGCCCWQDDNPVEEAVESAIQKATGADIDLTPASPEKSNEKAAIPSAIK